jgi:predicted class III extradiol MEMO1 family dioxygenase
MDERYQSTSNTILGTIIEIAKLNDWQVGALGYQNSADVDNEEQSTVGRASLVFYE